MISLSRLRTHTFEALPTVVVLVVVVLVGTRLMYLSVQHHAAVAHETAAATVAEFAARLEPPLVTLANLAARQTTSAAGVRADSEHVFYMTPNRGVARASPGEAALAAGIAGEWQSAEASGTLPAAAILGPMRLGSRWVIAARAPTSAPGWAVAFANLDDLIADSHLGRLTGMGYDFELLQIMPRGAQARVFIASSEGRLTDAVGTQVRLPLPTIADSTLQLLIRPHSGWYPSNLLAAEIGLLAFLTWLLAFGTHDLSHALRRSRSALTTVRQRLRAVNQQLAAEIQQRVSLQENFAHALFHDAFTGLPNRRYFMDRLDRALRDVRAKQRAQIAVIIVDITRFKLVNDLLGHTAGDELMVQAARRFEKLAAQFDGVLARWGGDQFALLILKFESRSEVMDIGALLKEELRVPFQLRRHQLVVAASVGLTCTDAGQQRAEDVVREADIALSVAKQSEGAKIVLYAPNMSNQAATLVSLEADLHIALEKRQLQLLLQPVVDLRTYKMVGAEALLRWRHPVENVLAPERFLRIAEEAGLMLPITRWIILRTLKIVADWRRRMPVGQAFYISVNLSPTALRDPELAAYVGTLLREMAIPPSYLKFEVSEAALINNVAAARDTLERLHALGVGLMLDDFGTGFTSLSNLQLFPFDFVKIERPFVNLNDSDRANTGMMAAMVQMVASLNLTSIAEIIESEAAATALQQMGCEYGQGFYFSEPIDAEAALGRMRSQEPFRPRAPSNTLAVPALPDDTSATRVLAPLADPSPTLVIAPLDDASPTRIMTPLEDPSPTLVVAPLEDSSPTRMLTPLTEESVPAAGDPPVEDTDAEDTADTAATRVVQPLDASPTMLLPPLVEDTSSTVEVPPLQIAPREDSSPTIILPTGLRQTKDR